VRNSLYFTLILCIFSSCAQKTYTHHFSTCVTTVSYKNFRKIKNECEYSVLEHLEKYGPRGYVFYGDIVRRDHALLYGMLWEVCINRRTQNIVCKSSARKYRKLPIKWKKVMAKYK